MYRLVMALNDANWAYPEYRRLYEEIWPTLSKWQKQRFRDEHQAPSNLHTEALDYLTTTARLEQGKRLGEILDDKRTRST